MKRHHWVAFRRLLSLILVSGLSAVGTSSPETSSPALAMTTAVRAEAVTQAPLLFEANRGQTADAVQFYARGRGFILFLSGPDAVLKLNAQAARITADPAAIVATPAATLRMRLLNAAAARGLPLGRSPATVNYLTGNDRTQWRTDVHAFTKVHFPSIYPGIDLLYYGNEGKLEYDFVVAPGANPASIALQFDGASSLAVGPEGDLQLHVAGSIFSFKRPIAYQETLGSRTEIPVRYWIRHNGAVAFDIAPYDRTQPLIIDPVLLYSTYLGGSSSDSGSGIAVDVDGNVYVTGNTSSVDFPTLPKGPLCGGIKLPCVFQDANAGASDAFVTKFNASGSLVYSTYIGGSGNDLGNAIAVDSDGTVYITGSTSSTDFPTDPSPCGGSNPPCPFRTSNAGGEDAFVTKLSASGSSLLYSTYLGGSLQDRAYDIALVFTTGIAVVVGETFSGNFPTVSPFQANNMGSYDGFVTRLSADGTTVTLSSYLGGSGQDTARGVAVGGPVGTVFIVGSTFSDNFPVAGSATQPTRGGFYDGFVTALSGFTISTSTYFGGSANDHAMDVVADSSPNSYVVGQTVSTDFRVLRASQVTNGGGTDAFVARFTGANLSLFSSTYFGGNGHDVAYGVARDNTGAAVLAGSTNSTNLPVLQAFQESFGGSFDAFVASVPSAGFALRYATYLGGPEQDQARGIAASQGNIYVTGFAGANFPTLNPARAFAGGSTDAFFTKLSPNAPPVANAGPDQILETDNPASTAIRLDGTASSDPESSPLTFTWRDPGGNTVGNTAVIDVSVPLGTHVFTLSVNDGGGGSDVDSVSVTVMSDTTAPAVNLIAPNGGEKLFSGTPYSISFVSTDQVHVARQDVLLSTDGGATFAAISECTNLAPSATSCTWLAPSPLTAAARVRLLAQDTSGNVGVDTSTANFSIVTGAATLTVTSPNTALDWGIASHQQIKWAHNFGANAFVRIEKSTDGGDTWATIVDSYKNTAPTSGTYNWQVTGPPTEEGRIRVSWTAAPGVSDVSNVNYVISPAFIVAGSPATTSTNYGYGTARKQTWTTNLGPLDVVEAWLSTDGGATYSTSLGSIVASTKTLSFTVPALTVPTSMARIRVHWITNTSVQGTTPVDFTVAPAFLKVVQPNGPSDVWAVGTSQVINWIHNLGNLEQVAVDLSRDGGATYDQVVLATTPSDGTQSTPVSGAWTSAAARIRIRWLRNAAVADTSNQSFPIQ